MLNIEKNETIYSQKQETFMMKLLITTLLLSSTFTLSANVINFTGEFKLVSGERGCSKELSVNIIDEELISIDDEETVAIEFPLDHINKGYFSNHTDLENTKQKMDQKSQTLTFFEKGTVEYFPVFSKTRLEIDVKTSQMLFKTSGIGIKNVSCIFSRI